MALRTIRIQGDPVLTKVCRPIPEVTDRIRTLAEDMLETMYEANGVGLAAPQVGILKRMVAQEHRAARRHRGRARRRRGRMPVRAAGRGPLPRPRRCARRGGRSC